MSNLEQINRNTNNFEQNKHICFWIVTAGSVLLTCTTVLANIAKIADSTKEFCNNYDIGVMQGVCKKLEEMQKRNPIDSPPQASKIPTHTPKPDNFPKFQRLEPQKTGIAANKIYNSPKLYRLPKTSEPQPSLPTFRRLKDKYINEK